MKWRDYNENNMLWQWRLAGEQQLHRCYIFCNLVIRCVIKGRCEAVLRPPCFCPEHGGKHLLAAHVYKLVKYKTMVWESIGLSVHLLTNNLNG